MSLWPRCSRRSSLAPSTNNTRINKGDRPRGRSPFLLSIEEKPLVRAAFLLCKKVQVFVEGYGDAPIRGAFCAIWENASSLLV